MASNAAKATRRAHARTRLDGEVRRVATRLDVTPPDGAPPARDPELAAIQEMERQADLLKAINAALDARESDDADGDTGGAGASDGEAPAVNERTSRDDLNAYARRAGIEDPESFPNKPALIEAINAAEG